MAKFYRCKLCGNVVEVLYDKGGQLVCCKEQMSLLVPNTTDGAKEKHIPVVTIVNNSIRVQIGSVIHPMEDSHYITFIYVETDKVILRFDLKPHMEPIVCFELPNDAKVIAVYEYCNIHGLWAVKL